jgi:neutral ceramidase
LCQQHGRALADEVKRLMGGPFQPIEPRFTARRAVLEVPHLEPPPQGDAPVAVKSLEIAVWAFGDDLAMVFLPDEVVVDYALRMKREMDGDRLWINAYCNDVSAYIVSQRLIDEGGYEVRGSLSSRISNGQPEQVQPPMEDRIIEHVRTLLPESYRSSTR